MNQTKRQWHDRFFRPVFTGTTREKTAPKTNAVPDPSWLALWDDADGCQSLRVHARTKSEARAELKRVLGRSVPSHVRIRML